MLQDGAAAKLDIVSVHEDSELKQQGPFLTPQDGAAAAKKDIASIIEDEMLKKKKEKMHQSQLEVTNV